LLSLVRALLDEGTGVLSLVALADGSLAGHVVFTACSVSGATAQVALLAPLAVAPDRQGQDIGSALVRAGLERMCGAGVARALVLGDPAYYGRFGFVPERAIAPPYELPAAWRDAWQSLALDDDTPPLAGTLTVPPPWRHPALWSG
jgi:putative acetyltransferase